MNTLPHTLVLYVPVGARGALPELLAAAVRLAGGATQTEGVGLWEDGAGAVVSEAVTLVRVALPTLSAREQLRREWRALMAQTHEQVVAIEDSTGMHLYPRPDTAAAVAGF